MKTKIFPLEVFKKDVKELQKKYNQIFSDLKELNKILKDNPKAGRPLGKNCFKIRLQNSSIPTGKSGGFRVIYYFLDKNNNIYLMTIYSKTDQDNISDYEIAEILKKNNLF